MDKLRPHGIYDEMQSYHDRISSLLLLQRHRPKALIVGIEVPSVDHRVYRIDGIEVLVDKDISLLFCWQHTYDFCKAASTCPVVGEGMLRTQAEERLRSPTRKRNVGQQEWRRSGGRPRHTAKVCSDRRRYLSKVLSCGSAIAGMLVCASARVFHTRGAEGRADERPF